MCPTGWINAAGTSDCYRFERNGPGVTWTQANYYCISVGSKLAEITDQRSQDFVRRYGDPNIFWWLGGYKESSVSVYYLWEVILSFQLFLSVTESVYFMKFTITFLFSVLS